MATKIRNSWQSAVDSKTLVNIAVCCGSCLRRGHGTLTTPAVAVELHPFPPTRNLLSWEDCLAIYANPLAHPNVGCLEVESQAAVELDVHVYVKRLKA